MLGEKLGVQGCLCFALASLVGCQAAAPTRGEGSNSGAGGETFTQDGGSGSSDQPGWTAPGEAGGGNASGGSDSGSASGGSGGSADVAPEMVTIPELVDKYEAARCAKLRDCCTYHEAAIDIDRCADGSVARFTSSLLLEEAERGVFVLDPDGARACIDALEAMSCLEFGDRRPGPLQSCPTLARPQPAMDESCAGHFECLPTTCEPDEFNGECGRPGQPCSRYGNCPTGYFCSHVCIVLRAEGEQCGFGRKADSYCESKHCGFESGHCERACDGDGIGSGRPPCPGDVTFADARLEGAVRRALGIPTGAISGERAAKLMRFFLDPSSRGVASLSGIECLVNLTAAGLRDNSISDLTPLAQLTNLSQLDLSMNQIVDLGPLAALTNLSRLDLSTNQVADIAPLAALTNLSQLHLSANQVADIAPLAGLTNLRELHLDANQIASIAPLAGLESLTDLVLTSNQIADLSTVAGLTNLERLSLEHNQVSDLTLGTDLTNLGWLYLSENRISDVSPLAQMTGLRALDLGRNQVRDIGPLAGLAGLGSLFLAGNEISDIAPLAALTSLSYVDLGDNDITDITPLASLALADDFRLSNNPIVELAPLVALWCPPNLDERHTLFINGLPGEPFCDDPSVAALKACQVDVHYEGACMASSRFVTPARSGD